MYQAVQSFHELLLLIVGCVVWFPCSSKKTEALGVKTAWTFSTLPDQGWCCAVSHQNMNATDTFKERSQEEGSFDQEKFNSSILFSLHCFYHQEASNACNCFGKAFKLFIK